MPAPFVLGPYHLERDREPVAEILSRSFGFPAPDSHAWLERGGLDNARVLRRGGEPVACLLVVSMGQYFGGRSVSTGGIAGVGVAPHRRSEGAAHAMMVATLRELRQRGVALSTLYPATQALYRKSGYELAGSRHTITVPTATLPHGPQALSMRPATPEDNPAMRRAYSEQARLRSGWLDRGEYIWSRVHAPKDFSTHAYVAGAEGTLEGYVVQYAERRADGRYDLRLTDLVALTPRAHGTLLRFLAGHRSMVPEVSWPGGPADPMLGLLPEPTATVRLSHPFMVRIVDLVRALQERGYPPGLEAELHLDVRDELLPENSGRVVLTVGEGRGAVRRGGRGKIELDVRGLAPLYTGHLSAELLRAAGHLAGTDDAVARASAVFAGPAPTMADMF